MLHVSRSISFAYLVALAVAFGQPADGEVFVLESGGRIQGEWVNRGESPLKAYVIETASGRLTLAKSQVRETIRQRAEELEYERLAPAAGDSLEEQWKLAEWCRENRLTNQRAAHLRRIIELDPDHAPARHGLGFTQLNGEWIRKEQWKEDEGYVLYRGRWRTAQEIELIEVRRKRDLAEREWLGKMKRYRALLASPRAQEAHEEILAIRDPYAVRALSEYLKKEPHRPLKMLYIEALGTIEDKRARVTLIETSLNDTDVEIFHACADQIVRAKPPYAVAAYIQGLKDKNNVRVNRAAQVLARLEDEEAIVPLIEALVTTHVVKVTPPGNNSTVNSTLVKPANDAAKQILPNGTSSASTGDRSRVFPLQVPNQDVLAALVQLSGGTSFGFDKQAWSNWHSLNQNEQQPGLNGRSR